MPGQLCDVMMICGHYWGRVYIVAPITASQIVSTRHHIIDQTLLACVEKLPGYETRYEHKSPAKIHQETESEREARLADLRTG